MDLETVTDPTAEQIVDYCTLYQSYLWWQNRTLDDMYTVIKNTNEIVDLADVETDTLVAVGLFFTDFAYYREIYDVIIKKSLQGYGISYILMNEPFTYPASE